MSRFETPIARGRGVVRLIQDPATKEWLGYTLLTAIEELKGYEEPNGALRPNGMHHGQRQGRKTWKDQRAEALAYENREPEVDTSVAASKKLPVR